MQLVKYDAACRALAECRKVDEVKDIRDKAAAMAAYARQSKNKDLEIDAAEIRLRAERRIGEMIGQQRESGELAKPGRPPQINRVTQKPDLIQPSTPTLADLGIDKNTADRARKLAAVSSEHFEQVLVEHREAQQAVTAATFVKLEKAGEGDDDYVLRELSRFWSMASKTAEDAFLERAGLTRIVIAEGLVDERCWSEFVAHRQNIRKPLHKLSAAKNWRFLSTLSVGDQRASVDATIANNWTGLFPPKGNNGNHQINNRETAADRVRRANPITPDAELDRYL